MRTTLRTFATALAATGMLGIGSLTAMGQDAGDQPSSNAPPAQPSAESDRDASADNQAGTPEAPAAPGDEATRSGAPGNEAASDATGQGSPDANQRDQNQNANRPNESQNEAMPWEDDQSREGNVSDDRAEGQREARDQAEQSEQSNQRDEQRDVRAQQREQGDTPPVPEQARQANRSQDANFDRNADWRTTRYNDQWWYYAPNGQWNYHRNGQWQTYQADTFQRRGAQDEGFAQGESWSQGSSQQQPYSTGYRGEGSDQGYVTDEGQAPQLRYDRCGRAYICENGRKMYVDVSSTQSSTSAAYRGEQSVYQDSQSSAGPPSVPQDPSQRSMNRSTTGGQFDSGSESDLGRPTPAREDLRVAPPAPPQATP